MNAETIIRELPHCYLAVFSTDGKFMGRLVNWLNSQVVEEGSTIIRVHDMDPYEEVALLRAQIEGMKIRLHDAEHSARMRD
jgi:hypothetical protein